MTVHPVVAPTTDRSHIVTGVAGFIGFHAARRLLADGHIVVGLDSMSDYYDPALKDARLAQLRRFDRFSFHLVDCADEGTVNAVFAGAEPSHVVHLAAQAGVRHSLTHPQAYLRANLLGFGTIIEACRQHRVEHLVYASSSSVYGETATMPFDVHGPADHPVSLYAATKRANELMAHSYSHLYGLATTGLRFFTVYGPWGRPDMAYFRFAQAIIRQEPLKLYGDGAVMRDFTYIDDVVEALLGVLVRPPTGSADWSSPALSRAPYRLYNIGHGEQTSIKDLIAMLESMIGREALIAYLPAAPGDIAATQAETGEIAELTGSAPSTSLHDGMAAFVNWLPSYLASS